VLEVLGRELPNLARLAASGEMETMLVFIPESTRRSSINSWSTKLIDLKPRQLAEEVMAEPDDVEPIPTTPASKRPVFPGAAAGSIPACFQSFNSCATTTKNCSGHGVCEDKYLRNDGTTPGAPCFYCKCQGTVSESGSYTHWAGPICSKVDVSVPFWLFTSFTIVMIGVLAFAIGLLFGVGEEKLPGVIGAGVSKSK
jgi:Domain of unknown function (DUF3844)